MQQRYSENFKRKMVQRMTGPDPVSATLLAAEVGVGHSTLSRWRLTAGTIGGMASKKHDLLDSLSARRADDRAPEEKLRIVLEAAKTPEAELGAFLRREGIHEADLDAWRDAMLSGLKPTPAKGQSAQGRRVRELEKELRRKDRALAETAALLVLQKKVQAIWGDEDDDTRKESDE